MRAPRRPLDFQRALPALLALAAVAFPAAESAGDGTSPAAPSAPAAARPKIAFDRLVHDFGTAKQNADVTTEFTVRNEGTATLHVTDVHGDCGCAAGSISTDAIPAGGTAKITCVFHTYTFVGPQTKTVRVVCDDPDARETSLKLIVDVSAGIVLEPANFFYGPVLVGTSPSASVVAKWREGAGRPFKILGVEAAGIDDVSFETKPFDAPPWHGFTLTARFTKPPPEGTTFASARIRTDDPDVPRIEARISGTVSPRVYLSQRVATVGLVARGKGATLSVVCRGFDATIDVGAVTVASKKGVVSARAFRDPKVPGQWTIEIRLPETTPSGPVDDLVEVRTAVAGEEVSEIKVVGTVLPAPR